MTEGSRKRLADLTGEGEEAQVEWGHPAGQILRTAEGWADLIVMGTHGRKGLSTCCSVR